MFQARSMARIMSAISVDARAGPGQVGNENGISKLRLGAW